MTATATNGDVDFIAPVGEWGACAYGCDHVQVAVAVNDDEDAYAYDDVNLDEDGESAEHSSMRRH